MISPKSTLAIWVAMVCALLVSSSFAQSADSTSARRPAHVVCHPCSVNFGDVRVGESRWISVKLENQGGSPTIITSESESAASISLRGLHMPYVLAIGRTVRFRIIFTPADSGVVRTNVLFFTNSSKPVASMSVSGVGTVEALRAYPPQLNFGRVQVGQSKTETETITNHGSRSLTLEKVATSGEFSLQGVTTPLTLEPKHSLTFEATFKPSKAGSTSGEISVTTRSRETRLAISESGDGTGNGSLGVTPSRLSFGNVTVGNSKTLPVTLSASGSSVTVTSDSLGSAEYAISGLSLPKTISPGDNITFQVTFSPQSAGQADSSMGLTTSGGGGVNVPVAGDGVSSTPPSVSLSWQPDSSGVSGYNIYRQSPGNGKYKKINSSLDTTTAYTDTNVYSGKGYSYYVTAVNSQGLESSPSNFVSVSIPSN